MGVPGRGGKGLRELTACSGAASAQHAAGACVAAGRALHARGGSGSASHSDPPVACTSANRAHAYVDGLLGAPPLGHCEHVHSANSAQWADQLGALHAGKVDVPAYTLHFLVSSVRTQRSPLQQRKVVPVVLQPWLR